MKLVDAVFKPELKSSYAIVEHRGELFYGTAKCHSDDMKVMSRFAGCAYAEMRATIKALKAERKREKEQCEIIRKFVKAVTQYKDFDNTSREARAMFRQLNRRIKKVNVLTGEIDKCASDLQTAIALRDNFNQALKRKKMDQRAKAINTTE